MKYELVLIWENKTKDVYEYDTEAEAEDIGRSFVNIFGNQIEWYGVRSVHKWKNGNTE